MRIEYWLQVLSKCNDYETTSHRLFHLTNIFKEEDQQKIDEIIGTKKKAKTELTYTEEEIATLTEILGRYKITDTNHSEFLKGLRSLYKCD